ncbi:hypothetical protein JR338_06150 [Chloroflexota bacterium]|nr:hypothetical protein JR338_06150 [Chloroflexota bacterium]
MSFHKTKKSTHQNCRSLLQKAIRRGNEDITRKTAYHLIDNGDKAWLRSRCVVICAEECWPYLRELNYTTDEIETLENLSILARRKKNKDAAGLGSLGYALSQGEESVLQGQTNNKPVKIISRAITRPDAYWLWLKSLASRPEEESLVDHLISLHKKGGWPWDRAFIQAAGYLFFHDPKEILNESKEIVNTKFPFWVAIDKHTADGKNAIRDTADELGIPNRQLGWISFYMESGRTRNSHTFYWWEREKKWRLNKLGISVQEAEDIWKEARLKIAERLSCEAKELEDHINQNIIATQHSLF